MEMIRDDGSYADWYVKHHPPSADEHWKVCDARFDQWGCRLPPDHMGPHRCPLSDEAGYEAPETRDWDRRIARKVVTR